MFRRLFVHTVNVLRGADSVNNFKLTSSAPAQVLANVQCRIDPLTTRMQESILGRIPQARFKMMWGAEDIRQNDIIQWNGKKYVLKDVQSEAASARSSHSVGVLCEVQHP